MAATPIDFTRPDGETVTILTSEIVAIATLEAGSAIPPTPGPCVIYTTAGSELVAQGLFDCAAAITVDPIVNGGVLVTADGRYILWISGYLTASAIVAVTSSTTSVAYQGNGALEVIVEEPIDMVSLLVFIPPTGGGGGPVPSDATPQPISATPGSGGSLKYSREGHAHGLDAPAVYSGESVHGGEPAPTTEETFMDVVGGFTCNLSDRVLILSMIALNFLDVSPSEVMTVVFRVYAAGVKVAEQTVTVLSRATPAAAQQRVVTIPAVATGFLVGANTDVHVSWEQTAGSPLSIQLADPTTITVIEQH